jgi:diguanylate cyclase (GGDEF)-like protein
VTLTPTVARADDEVVDKPTGLVTRQEFSASFAVSLRHARERHSPLALIWLAVDRFGELNLENGAEAGNVLLVDIAGRLRSALDDRCMLFCLGGEALWILCENHDSAAATMLARRLTGAFREVRLESRRGTYPQPALSAGVASLPAEMPEEGSAWSSRFGFDAYTTLVASAEIALLDAKRRHDPVGVHRAGVPLFGERS